MQKEHVASVQKALDAKFARRNKLNVTAIWNTNKCYLFINYANYVNIFSNNCLFRSVVHFQ